VSRLWGLLNTEYRQVVAWCVLLNIWFIVSTTPIMTRAIEWLALAVPSNLAGH
jgi:hypothetical protein